MKRYEVTRQLIDGDFPRYHQYTDGYRVRTHSGQCLSGVGWGQCQASPDNLCDALSLRADFLADDEHLPQDLLVSAPRSEAS